VTAARQAPWTSTDLPWMAGRVAASPQGRRGGDRPGEMPWTRPTWSGPAGGERSSQWIVETTVHGPLDSG